MERTAPATLPARLRCCILWLLPWLSLCQPLPAASREAPAEVQDLQYGEVLFHFYQQDYFNSIVRLLMAQQQNRLAYHKEEAELLLGGLDLSYGLRDTAEGIFQRLLNEETTSAPVRNRAWFYLARSFWQRDEPGRALQALGHIDTDMPASISAEADNLHSLVLMQLGRNDEAVTLLQQPRRDKGHDPYRRYNLGVALIRSDLHGSGAKALEQVGEQRAGTPEMHLLRDKANLALGYSYLQNGDAARSRQRLERVRLNGPLSNKALLGTGWADMESGEYGRALVPWTELSRRSATDPAVQESLLAIPYAMNRMKLHGRAVQGYEQALQVFTREQQQLQKSIHAIQAGELLDALQGDFTRTGNSGMNRYAGIGENPVLHYQPELTASHRFQEALKNYRDLLVLEDNLEVWAESIAAYDEMLASRRSRYADILPAAEQALESQTLNTLARRHADLDGKITLIEVDEDLTGLANTEEGQQWTRLEAIADRLEQLPPSEEVTTLREKQQFLRGILYWQLNADFRARLWEARQQVTELQGLLSETRQARGSLQQTGLETPHGFAGIENRIADNRAAIKQLQSRTTRTRLAQGKLIEHLAIAELERQIKRLEIYTVQARFALAQTYDNALQTDTGIPGEVAP